MGVPRSFPKDPEIFGLAATTRNFILTTAGRDGRVILRWGGRVKTRPYRFLYRTDARLVLACGRRPE